MLVHGKSCLLMKLLALLLVCLLTACQKTPPEISSGSPGQPGVNSGSKAGALTATLEPTPEPDRYVVALVWNGMSTLSSWVLQRENRITGLEHLATLEKSATEYQDKTVLPGETYRYLLTTLGPESPSIQEQALVTIPKDLIVEGTRRIRTIRNFQRLFFASGSQIVTDGNPLFISVHEIHSSGGTIRAFELNQTAGVGKAGKHGGLISVEATAGSGKLTINAGGENGGKGLKGAAGIPGAPGAPGRPAIPQLKYLVDGDSGDGAATQQFLASTFFNQQRPADYLKPRFFCHAPPTNGQDGLAGGPGTPGAPGEKGGDTAQVLVRILRASPLEITVEGTPGIGGDGGDGGDGGPGGLGGPPGGIDPAGVCPQTAAAGKPGLTGSPGTIGAKGSLGLKQPVCLKIGTSVFGNCDAFRPEFEDGQPFP